MRWPPVMAMTSNRRTREMDSTGLGRPRFKDSADLVKSTPSTSPFPFAPAGLGPLTGPGRVYLVTGPALVLTLAGGQIVVLRRLANVPMAFIPMDGVFSMLYLLRVALDIWIWGGGLE